LTDKLLNAKVLVVEDDRAMARLLRESFEDSGCRVHHVEEAEQALVFLQKEDVDVMLLDVQLPGLSGMTLLKILKENPKTARLPVIMLTVLGEEAHRVKGLQSGADDYLAKPFSTRELLARTAALLRRVNRRGDVAARLSAQGLTVDLDEHEAKIDGSVVPLGRREFEILVILLKNAGKVMSPEQIGKELPRAGSSRAVGTLKAHIKNMRKKLGARRDLIKTVKGFGYKIDP